MERIQRSFGAQDFMRTLGARLESCEPGIARIGCEVTEGLKQQHGYAHAGVLASLADSACGYAALSMMPDGSEVVSVEFKINMLRPCTAKEIVAEGRVLKNGRSIVVCEGVVRDRSGEVLFAKMTATMFRLDEASGD